MKYLVVPAILSFGLFGCNSKELTRSKAAAIIQRALKYPQPYTDTLMVGQIPLPRPMTWQSFETSVGGKQAHGLASQGVITLDHKDNVVIVELTDKGKQYLVGDETQLLRGMRRVTLKFCEKQFNEVTGIVMLEAPVKMATVEYTWKLANPTVFETVTEQALAGETLTMDGKTAKVPKHLGVCESTKTNPAKAVLKLYDDGWRYDSELPI